MSKAIDTGDVVLHVPTGEEWIVAYVRGDRLAWCGWPQGEAALADCSLVKKATDDERTKLLHDLAAINAPDMRCSYARNMLEKEKRDE